IWHTHRHRRRPRTTAGAGAAPGFSFGDHWNWHRPGVKHRRRTWTESSLHYLGKRSNGDGGGASAAVGSDDAGSLRAGAQSFARRSADGAAGRVSHPVGLVSNLFPMSAWAHRRKDENGRVRDADGDTAGSIPNSFGRNYRSCVPRAPGMKAGFRECGRLLVGDEFAATSENPIGQVRYRCRPQSNFPGSFPPSFAYADRGGVSYGIALAGRSLFAPDVAETPDVHSGGRTFAGHRDWR